MAREPAVAYYEEHGVVAAAVAPAPKYAEVAVEEEPVLEESPLAAETMDDDQPAVIPLAERRNRSRNWNMCASGCAKPGDRFAP